jgi:hypothetical protein
MKGFSRHFSYANVMSTLAVFLGIAGGSVAIAAVPDNDSVDSSKVLDESLKSRDLMDGRAVESSDVVDEEIGAADIAAAGVKRSEIGTGAVRALEINGDAVGSAEIASSAVGSSEIATDSIFQSEVAPSAVGGTEIINGSITGSDIGDGQLNASEIGGDAIYKVESNGTTFEDVDSARNGDYGIGSDSVTCSDDRGSGELISGGANWENDPDEGDEQFISEIKLNMDTETVTVVGGLDNGSQGAGSFRTLRAIAVCLSY